MSNFDYAVLGILFVLFMANTWYQYRLGFKEGSQGGYAVGMYHAINWFMINGKIADDDLEKPPSAINMLEHILKSSSLHTMQFSDAEEMKQVANIFNKIDQP